jgi:hypothetical protein
MVKFLHALGPAAESGFNHQADPGTLKARSGSRIVDSQIAVRLNEARGTRR